jgi:hypothetical protein
MAIFSFHTSVVQRATEADPEGNLGSLMYLEIPTTETSQNLYRRKLCTLAN